MPTVIILTLQFTITPIFKLTNQQFIKKFGHHICTTTDYLRLINNNTDVTESIQHHSLSY